MAPGPPPPGTLHPAPAQPKQFQGIYQGLYEREELRFGSAEQIGVDAEEVEALVRRRRRGAPAGMPHAAAGCRRSCRQPPPDIRPALPPHFCR